MFSLTFARTPAPLRSPNFTIGIDVFGQETRFLRPWTTGAVFFSKVGFWPTPPLIAKIALQKQQQKSIELDINTALENHKNLDYFRVKVSGKFDHSREIQIVPRQMLDPYEGTQTRHTRGSLHTGAEDMHKSSSATDQDRNYGAYRVVFLKCRILG